MSNHETIIYIVCTIIFIFAIFLWAAVRNLMSRVLCPQIFISYRRSDRPDVTAQVFQHLKKRFGKKNVFFDLVGIQEGKPFPDILIGAVARSDVVVAVVGGGWDGRMEPEEFPRILDFNDWVRNEVKRANDVLDKLIIVLVKGPKDEIHATIPKYETEELKAWTTSEWAISEKIDYPQLLSANELITSLRLRQSVRVSLRGDHENNGIDELCKTIEDRNRGSGQKWILRWWCMLPLLVLAWIGTIWIGGRIAIQADVIRIQDTIDTLDSVIICPLTIDEFMAEFHQLDREKIVNEKISYQFICWNLRLQRADFPLDQNTRKYRVELVPETPPANGKNFEISAFFDEQEFTQQVAPLWAKKKNGKEQSLWLSGRVDAVTAKGVRLDKCRVVVRTTADHPTARNKP